MARLSRRRWVGCSGVLMLVAPNIVAPIRVPSRVQNDEQFDFGVWKLPRNIDTDAARLHDLFPRGTRAANSKILTLDFRGDRGRRHWQVGERQTGQRRFHDFRKELAGTDFDQTLGARYQLKFADFGPYREDPPGAVEATLVRNLALVEVAAGLFERHGNTIRGDHQFQMSADMFIQTLEAWAEVQMVIARQRLRMRVQPERAQASGKTRHFEIKLLWMTALGQTKMAEDGEAGIDGVHEPEARDLLGREPRHAARTTAGARKRRAFFVQDSNKPPGDHHKTLTGADLQAGGDKSRVVEKMSGTISDNASDRKAHHAGAVFKVEEKSQVLAC